MSFLNLESLKVSALLEQQGIPLSEFQGVLRVIRTANQQYYGLSERHKHFYKLLVTNQEELKAYSGFRTMSVKEREDLAFIKNNRAGDRGYVNRYLISLMKTTYSGVYQELIEPRLAETGEKGDLPVLEFSDEIETLLLVSNIPGYFVYLQQLSTYKGGVFNKLRRNYISFLEAKSIHAICEFLKAYECRLPLLDRALLNGAHQKNWSQINAIFQQICHRADPNHHDPLSLQNINCLRSIYVSLFNMAMEYLQTHGAVPMDFRKLLPTIPDILDFSKNSLECDNAWNRYQEHQFLFMRLPRQQRARLEECLKLLSPSERMLWIGCLGKEEIHTLILPMTTQCHRFESLAKACQKISSDDQDNYLFAARVWQVLHDIYAKYLKEKPATPAELHKLFPSVQETQPKPVGQQTTKSSTPASISEEEKKAILAIRGLSFLVVDDSDRIREMTVKVLKKVGVQEIYQASDGAQAWKMLSTHSINVVLCDWIMPEITGIQLLQKIMRTEKLASSTAFLMLTTVNEKSSIVEALSTGARGYLIKPFTRQQLFEKVLFATEWLRKEQQNLKPSTIALKSPVKPVF